MASANILTSITNHNGNKIATITINRPHKLNSLNTATLTQIPSTITHLLTHHDDLTCLILTGAGTKSFIGGADLSEMATLPSPASARAFITQVHRACDAIRHCPIPTIARINGFALGAGLEIAAACDMRIASSTAKFGMPEVRMGVPSVVEAALLPGLIGWGRTRRLLLLGDVIDAEEGLQWGLVERVVRTEMLDEAIWEWVSALGNGDRRAIGLQKELMTKWEDASGVDIAVQAGIESFGKAFESAEPRVLMGRFVTKAKI